MNCDLRLLHSADIRKRILDELAADIARLANRRKGGRLVSIEIGPFTMATLMRNAAIAFEKQIELGWV